MLKAIYRPLRWAYTKLHRPIYRYFFEVDTSITEIKKTVSALEDSLSEAHRRISDERTASTELFTELSERIENNAVFEVLSQIEARIDRSQMAITAEIISLQQRVGALAARVEQHDRKVQEIAKRTSNEKGSGASD
jgi:uncharacterized protein YlxW (UPF0749 family)